MPVERAGGSSTNSSSASSSSSFWRDGGARPGRVSGGGAKRGGGGGGSRQTGPTGSGVPAHTFHDFQESVSDAWDIEEPLTPITSGPSAPSTNSNLATVHTQSVSHAILRDSRPSAKTPVPQSLQPTMRLRRKRISVRNLRPYSANHQSISLSWRKLHGVGCQVNSDPEFGRSFAGTFLLANLTRS